MNEQRLRTARETFSNLLLDNEGKTLDIVLVARLARASIELTDACEDCCSTLVDAKCEDCGTAASFEDVGTVCDACHRGVVEAKRSACGHSACSQNFIDTGDHNCTEED